MIFLFTVKTNIIVMTIIKTVLYKIPNLLINSFCCKRINFYLVVTILYNCLNYHIITNMKSILNIGPDIQYEIFFLVFFYHGYFNITKVFLFHVKSINHHVNGIAILLSNNICRVSQTENVVLTDFVTILNVNIVTLVVKDLNIVVVNVEGSLSVWNVILYNIQVCKVCKKIMNLIVVVKVVNLNAVTWSTCIIKVTDDVNSTNNNVVVSLVNSSFFLRKNIIKYVRYTVCNKRLSKYLFLLFSRSAKHFEKGTFFLRCVRRKGVYIRLLFFPSLSLI